MAKTKGAAPARAWSGRSQRSIKRQFELEDQIGKFEKLIANEERGLANAEINRTRQAKMVIGGQGVYQHNLEESIAEIEQRKQKIKVYQEIIAGLQKEIQALQPSRSQASERARKQAKLALLAEERIGAVGSIDAAICVLKQRLDIHNKLTDAMVSLASEIDFSGQDFDLARFDNLAVSLPTAMQPESKRWLEWFLGMEKDRRECEIRRDPELFPETLAAAHCYRCGEKPLLTETERRKTEKPEPHVLTTNEFEAQCYNPKKPEEAPSGIIQHFIAR